MCSSGFSSLLDSKARCFGVCDFAVLNWDYSLVLFIFFLCKRLLLFLIRHNALSKKQFCYVIEYWRLDGV